jgi:hypothetical protein
MRAPFVLAALVLACARPNYAEHWPDRLELASGSLPGYAIKQIVEKVPPATLKADDGSICRTSRARFASTKLGRWVDCQWNLPDADSTRADS